jgi:transcriptional regulator of acetoin/glycerol metabolism
LINIAPEAQSMINNAPLAPPLRQDGASGSNENSAPELGTLDDIERQAIMATLRATGGDRTACARILGIDKSTLYRKLKRYNFVPADDHSEG